MNSGILRRIRSSIEFNLSSMRSSFANPNQTAIHIRIPCLNSSLHFRHVNIKCGISRNCSNIPNLFFHAYFLPKFYLDLIIEYTIDNMRAIHYDLKGPFSVVVYRISSKLEDVCTLLQLTPDTNFFHTIERKVRSFISGDLVIRKTKDVSEQVIGEKLLSLRFWNLLDSEIIVGNKTKVVLLFESEACYGRIANSLSKCYSYQQLIVFVTTGTSDLLTRLVVSRISKEVKNLIWCAFYDADKVSLLMVKLFKHGSNAQYCYLNDFLTVPQLYHIGIRGFQISTNSDDLKPHKLNSFAMSSHNFMIANGAIFLL